MTTITGYLARKTDKAYAIFATTETVKPLWVPISKIVTMRELDDLSVAVTFHGETFVRSAIPVELDIDPAWLAKVQ